MNTVENKDKCKCGHFYIQHFSTHPTNCLIHNCSCSKFRLERFAKMKKAKIKQGKHKVVFEKEKSEPVVSRAWRTFLKIDSHLKKDTPPDADSAYLLSRGIEPEAPIVLWLLQDEVRPLIREYKGLSASKLNVSTRGIKTFWFLVHNRESGVPTTEDDKASYLDITLVFEQPMQVMLYPPFVMTCPVNLEDINTPAGWDIKPQLENGLSVVNRLLHIQSELIMTFIESHPLNFDNFTMLKNMRQFMHYFANMTQMKIS